MVVVTMRVIIMAIHGLVMGVAVGMVQMLMILARDSGRERSSGTGARNRS